MVVFSAYFPFLHKYVFRLDNFCRTCEFVLRHECKIIRKTSDDIMRKMAEWGYVTPENPELVPWVEEKGQRDYTCDCNLTELLKDSHFRGVCDR